MVAEQAGVSTATVSLVVNGKTAGRVSPENVSRVERAIEELNYVVDRVASSLSRGSSTFVILVAPDIANPYFGRVITGVKEALGSAYQLLLAVTDVGQVPLAADVRALFAFRPAGLLVDAPSPAFLHDLAVEGPMVLLDAPGVRSVSPSVDLDVAGGARELAQHLVGRGHRAIAYLDSVTGTETFAIRREAVFDVVRAAGGETAKPVVSSVIEVDAAAEAFLAAWPTWRVAGTTAVVCATDTQAYGVLQGAQMLGLDVPSDLAVAGFDNLPYSTVTRPSLTTVELPGRELGHAAATHLRALIEGAEVRTPPVLRSRLVVRASTTGPVAEPAPAARATAP